MKSILAISGSQRAGSSTLAWLDRLRLQLLSDHVSEMRFEWLWSVSLDDLPLFSPERAGVEAYPLLSQWRQQVASADLLVIATPEYAHNMPAALKSALEWLVASGEFSRKRCLALTVTPAAPRGEYAIQSLLWTLKAMDAALLGEMQVYVQAEELRQHKLSEENEMLLEAIADLIRESL